MDNEELDYIRRNAHISTIGASTRIENAILMDAEVGWLGTTLAEDARTTAYLDRRDRIQEKLPRNKERSIDEVAGCRTMLHLISAKAGDMLPLSETIIRGLHNELLQSPDESLREIAPYLPIDLHIERKSEDDDIVLRRCSGGKKSRAEVTFFDGLTSSHIMCFLNLS